MSDSFYRAFEDRHRGSRELIKSRLAAYLTFLRPLTALYQAAHAIDLGCGRGEWLEILGEQGFDAYGVDLDEGMLEGCRERGLKARKADALASLRELPAESMALVSAFHVVEHLPFGDVRVLIREALRVLKPGGLLVLETPNPENLVVGASSFYQDPSHERPLPSELLNFAVEHAGFQRTKVLRLQESPQLREAPTARLLDVLNGVSPDYAVVAQKAAAGDVLREFDEPFNADYGLALATLAQRYDQTGERRTTDVLQSLMQMEARLANNAQDMARRIGSVEEKLAQAGNRIVQVEERAMQAEARAADAELRAVQSNAHLQAVLLSRSWRITAPIRYVTGALYRLYAAARERRLRSAIKNRTKSLLRHVGRAVLRHPRLTRWSLTVLNRLPGAKQKLRNILVPPERGHRSAQKPSSLSPRAARIYSALKKSIEARKK